AATQVAISAFTVRKGSASQLRHISKQERTERFTDGQFRYPVKSNTKGALRIDAEGYAPAIVDIPPADQPAELDIQLTAAGNITGVIEGDDGSPIAGVGVFL